MQTLEVRSAAILAGGLSSRMGREKALLPFEGRALVWQVAEILKPIFPQICVVTTNPEVASAAGIEAIQDQFPGRGPLGGIHAALTHFGAPTFVVACDMPFLNATFIRFLAKQFASDALVPQSQDGPEPLHAIYAPSCLPVFERALTAEGRTPSLRRLLKEVDTKLVSIEQAREFDPELRFFTNWNTPTDVGI